MIMEKINVIFPSKWHHCCQIATGFLLLKEQGWNVEIQDVLESDFSGFPNAPFVFAKYGDKTLVYDLLDGYNEPEAMKTALEKADFYFKRSFNREKNGALFPEFSGKIYPLGFNYHVTHRKNPINEGPLKRYLKPLQGRAPDIYFTPEVFEGRAERPVGQPRILFMTRLWEEEAGLSESVNAERRLINESRIHIIRTMKARYGDAFLGGLNDLPISRQLAPELIMPAKYTERRRYVKLLHSCDICIGTMGLHESIGWKTAEYVAAAKAIVNETFHYEVTGDFSEGKNYLAFETAQECIDAVQRLVDDPEKLQRMKQENEAYYREYLRPDVLVKNTLEMAGKIF